MGIIEDAKRVFEIEIAELEKVKERLDHNFEEILDVIIHCDGKVIITGMGKSGHIGNKIAATMSSLGTPSFFLHPAEALHGDLGMVSKDDVVIAISSSGESDEIINILPNIKMIGSKIIAITSNPNSTLVKYSDYSQIFPKFQEACYFNMAPTSSTTATLVYGDTLAVVASKYQGFNEKSFGLYHPAGSLGKRLVIKVNDLMATGEDNASITSDSTLKNAIVQMGKKGLGLVNIVDANNNLIGIITDGDIRRQLEKNVDIYNLDVQDVMTTHPYTISSRTMAVEALKVMKENNISVLPVLDGEILVGTIRLQSLIKAGIIL